MSLLYTSGRRHLAQHPWQTALAIAGVALGVAVVVGVDLANGSVERSFRASTEIVTGRSTHQVLRFDNAIDDSVFRIVQAQPGVIAAAPVIDAQLRLANTPDRTLTLLGLDPFFEAPFRGFPGATGASNVDLVRLLGEPGAVIISRSLALRQNLVIGDTLPVLAGMTARQLVIAGIVAQGRPGTDEMIVADIASAQEIAGMLGRISRIDVITDEASVEQIRAALPSGVEFVAADSRNRAVLGMTSAFRVNLTALSLLALLVGVFLIYSTMAFMVVRQRRTHGMLRAMGVTDKALFRATLVDALVIGIPGTVAGLLLGQLLGTTLVALVIRTVDDLYFSVVAAPGSFAPAALLKGAVLGLAGTLVAAVIPAREAARTMPRSLLSRASMERRAMAHLPRQLLAAVVLAAISFVLLRFGQSLVMAFAGLFAFVGAAALLTPGATVLFSRALERMSASFTGVAGRVALRGVSATLSRTGVAVAALAVAVAAVIGVGTMIGSFRASVTDWLERTVSADLYVSAPAGTGRSLDDALVEDIEALAAVKATRLIRRVRLPSQDGDLRIWAVRFETLSGALELLAGDAASAWPAFEAGDALLVSEALARKRRLKPGDTLSLRTDSGPRPFAIVGVFRDYTSDQGVAAMHLDTYRRYWPDRLLTGIGVFVTAAVADETARQAVEAVVGQRASVTASGDIRQVSLDIFDRTFTVTEVLRLLAGIVAFLGIFSALQSLQLERMREIATLRAIGFVPRQVGVVIVGQTAVLGLAAGVFAIPVGIGLAWLLVAVINARAFGWTMRFDISAAALAQGVALALAAALLAGIYPAIRSMRAQPAQSLRDE